MLVYFFIVYTLVSCNHYKKNIIKNVNSKSITAKYVQFPISMMHKVLFNYIVKEKLCLFSYYEKNEMKYLNNIL